MVPETLVTIDSLQHKGVALTQRANAALEYEKNCKRARSVFLQHIVPADISDHLPAKKGVKNFCAFTVENFRAAVRVLEN